MSPSNHIAVLVRFSYPAASGTRATTDGPGAARCLLYDPARLARRFALFEALTLPSLLAQTDTDFTTIFLIGADFPQPQRQRLARLIAPLADARLVPLRPLPHFKATRRAFDLALRNRLTGAGLTHLTTVRLDDDDAIANDLIARIRTTAAALLALPGGNTPRVISFHHGLYLEISARGCRFFRAIERLPLAVATAMVTPISQRDSVFSRNHRLLPQFYNCWSDISRPAFIRTIHCDNDSNPSASGQLTELSQQQARALIDARFNLPPERLRALLP